MENLRSLEPQAKISHSYKKKECIVHYHSARRLRGWGFKANIYQEVKINVHIKSAKFLTSSSKNMAIVYFIHQYVSLLPMSAAAQLI